MRYFPLILLNDFMINCSIFEHMYTMCILFNKTVPITPVHADDECIVVKFIRIQTNRHWFEHVLIIIHRQTMVSGFLLSVCVVSLLKTVLVFRLVMSHVFLST